MRHPAILVLVAACGGGGEPKPATPTNETPIEAAPVDESALLGHVNAHFQMDGAISVGVEACGARGADYQAALSRIRICSEISAIPAEMKLYVTAHLIGHALIDKLDLAAVGPEEEAAASLAAVIALELGDPALLDQLAIGAARAADLSASLGSFATEHPIDAARADTFVCWLRGADRDERCGRQQELIVKAWSGLLAPVRQ